MPETITPRSQYTLYQTTHQSRRNIGTTAFLLAVIAVPLLIFFGIYILIVNGNETTLYPITPFEVPEYWMQRAYIYNMYRKHHFHSIKQPNNAPNAIIPPKKDNFRLVCYYNFPDLFNSTYSLKPATIDPFLCTHLIVAFATIENNTLCVTEPQIEVLEALTALKRDNTALKVLLSVGGYGNTGGFSQMVLTHVYRKEFIKSVLEVVKTGLIDGIDLDWEFPNDAAQKNDDPRQKIHFAELLEEFRIVINKQNAFKFLLSVAVAAPVFLIDNGYKIGAMNEFVDFINIMTYDYHFYTKFTPFTGLNAPLFGSESDGGYFSSLNINFTANYWNMGGIDKSKMNIGLPTYAHTFRLMNVNNNGLYAPSRGYGKLGTNGFADWPQVCQFLNLNQIEPVFVEASSSPYAVKGTEWVSYENEKSISIKTEFVKDGQYGGVMVYSLNADDFNGVCQSDKNVPKIVFPLTQKIREVLSSNYSIL